MSPPRRSRRWRWSGGWELTRRSRRSGDLFPFLRVEQEDELPLVVEPLDSGRIRLSIFLSEYHTERMREERIVGGSTVFEMNGDRLRLNVWDRISQKGIEMQLPGRYPQELAPDA